MFNPLDLERAKIRAEILKHQATEADAQYSILDGNMRMQSLTPAALPGRSSGLSWFWLLVFALVGAAIGFGASAEDSPRGHHASTLHWLITAAQDAAR